jgi:hypothetical protein
MIKGTAHHTSDRVIKGTAHHTSDRGTLKGQIIAQAIEGLNGQHITQAIAEYS